MSLKSIKNSKSSKLRNRKNKSKSQRKSTQTGGTLFFSSDKRTRLFELIIPFADDSLKDFIQGISDSTIDMREILSEAEQEVIIRICSGNKYNAEGWTQYVWTKVSRRLSRTSAFALCQRMSLRMRRAATARRITCWLTTIPIHAIA